MEPTILLCASSDMPIRASPRLLTLTNVILVAAPDADMARIRSLATLVKACWLSVPDSGSRSPGRWATCDVRRG